MTHRLGAVPAACLVLSVLSGCGGRDSASPEPTPSSSGPAPAATVDGHAISVSELDRQLAAVKANPAAVTELEEQGPITGSFRSGFSAAFVAQLLQTDVEAVLIDDAVTSRSLSIPDGLGDALDAGDPAYASYDPDYRDELARRTAERVVLAGSLAGTPLTTATIHTAFLADRADDGQYCVSAVVLGSRAAATRVRARLVAGADIATLATQLSVDPTTRGGRGKLGCGGLGDFAGPLSKQIAALATGDFGQPVAVGPLWYVLTVKSRTLPTLAQAEPSIVQEIVTDFDPFNAFLDKALRTAEVSVDPALGRFDTTASPPAVTAASR